MSDPVTNVEIEDVLSSIRRLVSAEERRTDDDVTDAEAEDGQAEDKLVLTPAQRVDASRSNDADDEADEADTDVAEYEVHAPGKRGSPRRFDGVEDAEIVEAAEPAGTENEAAVTWHGDDPDDADAAGDDGDPAAGGAPDAAENGAQAASKEDIDLKELEARIAGFEAAVAEQDDEWEPDGSGDDDLVSDPVTLLPWQHDDAETAAEADDAGHTSTIDPSEDPAGTTTADRGGPAQARPEQGEGDDAAGDWFADDGYLDEEALRDMVSEIVRQELQGELGERITRNVRKLVRREIHRALLSQGME